MFSVDSKDEGCLVRTYNCYIGIALGLFFLAACEPKDPNAVWGKSDPISTDTSQIYYSGAAWFSVGLFDAASLRIHVENHFAGHFLKVVEIECDLILKNGQVAQTDNYRVYFFPPIPSGGASQGKTKVKNENLVYHIDDYSKGPKFDICRLVGAESIKRELVTDGYVSVTDVECPNLLYGKTRYRLKNLHPTDTVKSANVKCWNSTSSVIGATEGFWHDSGTLRRAMAPIGELLLPGSEEWLKSEKTLCPDSEPIICSVTVEF